MLNRRRFGAFAAVGVLGFVIQVAVIAALTALAHWSWLPATVVAVELAVIHNFLWHERWTWADRQGPALARLLRFNVANGLTSIAGNIALMGLFVGVLGWPVVISNVLAVGTMSAANFYLADRWVFARRSPIARAAMLVLIVPSLAAADPKPETLGAWQQYVARTEGRLQPARTWTGASGANGIAADGESIGVPSGTISHWRGSVFIRGVTLDRLLDGLQHPGTPPPQEDVVSSRVLARGTDSLRVYIRLVRSLIVSVAYDTEHEMTFRRWTPTVATARSVATRIDEAGGTDHGFLWRLHSYWRYDQRPGGVFVELESLTLSRSVPSVVRPVATPLVNRIARESMTRTLEALKRYFETPRQA